MIYSDFKAMIADHLNRSDLTTQIVNFGNLAVQKLAREPLYFLETYAGGVCTASQTYLPLPSDFVQESIMERGSSLVITGIWMERISSGNILASQIGTATPTAQPTKYSVVGNQVELYPIPNSAYVYRLYYYKNLAVPADASSNAWTSTAYDLLFHSVLCEAWDYLGNNDELIKAQTRRTELINQFSSISFRLKGIGPKRIEVATPSPVAVPRSA